jgi:CDGSH-type Zn-finger protein/uncharacterized Fe-S cluster protein YjdI
MAKRDYDKDGVLTVHWDSSLCSHSAKCIRAAPMVFQPDERPWVDVSAADVDTIVAGVDVCPSGALAYTWHIDAAGAGADDAAGAGADDTAGERQVGSDAARPGGTAAPGVQIRATADGPYEIIGRVDIVDADGTPLRTTEKAWLCRCGHSGNKPFCDGSHERVGFSAPHASAREDPGEQ